MARGGALSRVVGECSANPYRNSTWARRTATILYGSGGRSEPTAHPARVAFQRVTIDLGGDARRAVHPRSGYPGKPRASASSQRAVPTSRSCPTLLTSNMRTSLLPWNTPRKPSRNESCFAEQARWLRKHLDAEGLKRLSTPDGLGVRDMNSLASQRVGYLVVNVLHSCQDRLDA